MVTHETKPTKGWLISKRNPEDYFPWISLSTE